MRLEPDEWQVLHSVSSFTTHADYDATGEIENDVAILRLSDNIEFNENVRPACRPPTGHPGENTAFISGWGRISGGECQFM